MPYSSSDTNISSVDRAIPDLFSPIPWNLFRGTRLIGDWYWEAGVTKQWIKRQAKPKSWAMTADNDIYKIKMKLLMKKNVEGFGLWVIKAEWIGKTSDWQIVH